MRIARIHSRGFSLVYMTLLLVMMMFFISLAVDFGRVEVAKAQIRSAADAAARYAATGLTDGTYYSKAQTAISDNYVDGTAMSLSASEVIPGRWFNNAFTAYSTPYNAVKVLANRTPTRNGGIRLLWAGLYGPNFCNVTASSITRIAQSGGNGFVGLNAATFNTSGLIDSWNSTYGTYATTIASNGDVASNGTLTLAGGVQVKGDAYYRSGYSASGSSAVVAPGQVYCMASNLSYPNPTLPGTYTYYGAFSASSGSYPVAAGNYYFTSLTLSGSVTMIASGQVNIYVSGPISISGSVNNSTQLPGNFRVMTTTATTVSLNTSSPLFADIYCPNSAVTVGGTSDYYGRIIGQTLSVSGTPKFHYDESLNTLQNSISTVQ